MSCSNCNQKIDCDCKVVKSGDCDGLCDLITKKVDNHINATNMLDVCNKNFISDFFRWSVAHAMNVSCVLKNLKNQICSLWSFAKCIDNKTKYSTQVHDVWSGDVDVFSLPTMTANTDLSKFDYLDIHCYFGTERVVLRLSIARALTGGTIVSTDRVGGNSKYNVADGASIFKEIGINIPTSTSIKIHHFHWAVLGHKVFSMGTMEPAFYLQLGDDATTRDYAYSQNASSDHPHRIVLIQGVIAGNNDVCYGNTGYQDELC